MLTDDVSTYMLQFSALLSNAPDMHLNQGDRAVTAVTDHSNATNPFDIPSTNPFQQENSMETTRDGIEEAFERLARDGGASTPSSISVSSRRRYRQFRDVKRPLPQDEDEPVDEATSGAPLTIYTTPQPIQTEQEEEITARDAPAVQEPWVPVTATDTDASFEFQHVSPLAAVKSELNVLRAALLQLQARQEHILQESHTRCQVYHRESSTHILQRASSDSRQFVLAEVERLRQMVDASLAREHAAWYDALQLSSTMQRQAIAEEVTLHTNHIHYGEQVVLCVASPTDAQFLTAEAGKIRFKPSPSPAAVWKVLHKFSPTLDSVVRYGHIVALHHVASGTYLGVTATQTMVMLNTLQSSTGHEWVIHLGANVVENQPVACGQPVDCRNLSYNAGLVQPGAQLVIYSNRFY